VLTISC